MSDRFARFLKIISLLPQNSDPLSTKEVHERLRAETGFMCSKRTVERDLNALEEYLRGIVVSSCEGDADNSPLRWSISNTRGLLPEALLNNPNIALALVLLRQQAFNRLPRRVFDALSDLWESAAAKTRLYPETRSWMRLIQHLPDPLRPTPPAIDEAVHHTVEEALRHSAALELSVKTLDGGESQLRLQPLRLLLQEEVLYLLAADPHAQNDADLVQLVPMHHIKSAETRLDLDPPAVEPDIAQQLALEVGSHLRLKLRVRRELAKVLFARPIGRNQTLERCEERAGQYIVHTDIEDSPQLRRWLARRMPHELDVLEPLGLAGALTQALRGERAC